MEESKQQTWVFGSKYPGYMVTLEPGGPKFIPESNVYIPKVPFEGVTFVEGVFSTSDPKLAERLRAYKTYGVDFWEIKTPDDAKRVNQGRRIGVASGVKSTTQSSGRK